jgi:hypothetical protein
MIHQPPLLLLTAFFAFLFAAACSGENPSEPVNADEDDTVELIFGEQEVSFTAAHYASMTEEALEVFQEAAPLFTYERENLEKWFIRYYIQMHEYNENWTTDDMLDLARERMRFEKEWRSYAKEYYGVEVSEEMIEEEASYQIELYETNTPASIRGMADGLDMTLEEFFMEFDRDHVARTVIWEELYPLLQEKYAEEEDETVSAAHRYSEEVLYSLENNDSPFPDDPMP